MTFAVCGEKLRELPLLSFLCWCAVQGAPDSSGAREKGTVDLKLETIRYLEAGERAGGRAFQVVLQPPAFRGGPPPDTPSSLEESPDRRTQRWWEAEPLGYSAGEKTGKELRGDVEPLSEVS